MMFDRRFPVNSKIFTLMVSVGTPEKIEWYTITKNPPNFTAWRIIDLKILQFNSVKNGISADHSFL